MHGLPFFIYFVERPGEEQQPVQGGVKSGLLGLRAPLHLYAVQFPVPRVAGFIFGRFEVVVADFAAQVQLCLSRADERRSHPHVDLLPCAGREAEHGTGVFPFAHRAVGGEHGIEPGMGSAERFVEVQHEIIAEIPGHPTAVVLAVARHFAVGDVHLDHRAFEKAVHQDVGRVGLGEGESEVGGALGRCDFRPDVVVG